MTTRAGVDTRTDRHGDGAAADPEIEAPRVTGFLVEDAKDWDAYVLGHPDGSIFHTLRWRDAIRSTFSHRDKYLIARRDARVVGLLPMVEVSSLVFGTTLISVPFGVYGGLLADDRAAADLLIAHARDVARDARAKYVELRHLHSPVDGLPCSEIYHTFLADVPDGEEGCLQRIPRKARAEVRKALKDERLTHEIDTLPLEDFYDLFSINKRSLGSPLFPSSLFWHLRDRFGEDASILSVKYDGETVAAVMSFVYKDTVMPYYSGTVTGAERLRASNYMYYKLMTWASERGLERFDFGRSREDTGAFAFKKHQGFEPTRLSYDYLLNTANDVPSLNPSNPKYELARSVFRKMPLWMAKKVGSWVVKRAPF